MTKEEYLEGLGMPAPTLTHQKVVSRINNNFIKRFPELTNNFYPGMGISVSPELIPDLCLWQSGGRRIDDDPQNPLLTIEITHTRQNDKYSENSIRKSFACIPTLQEAFLYNYADNVWCRYKMSKSGIVKEQGQDYSSLLKIYLHTLLK